MSAAFSSSFESGMCKVLKKMVIWVRPGMWAHSEVFEAAGRLNTF